jgi:hypothetical protein
MTSCHVGDVGGEAVEIILLKIRKERMDLAGFHVFDKPVHDEIGRNIVWRVLDGPRRSRSRHLDAYRLFGFYFFF